MNTAMTTNTAPSRQTKHFPFSYGLIHLIIDAVTVTVTFNTILIHNVSPGWGFMTGVVLYDVLAFAGQALLGYLADWLRFSRSVVLAGIAFSALGVVFVGVDPLVAIILVGVGNALFHVGAGALSLFVTPGRATAPGIFVGPGAIGLALGTYMGKRGIILSWPMLGILAVAFVFALYSKNPQIPYKEKPKRLEIDYPFLIMGLLLFSIAIRSAVGMASGYQCPKSTWTIVFFVAAACFGKSLGGIVSDRLGWIKTSVGALLVSAPLIAFFGTVPALLIIGLFFFQMTMPVTLVAIAAVIPGRPAFAFGLACLVLVAGAIPTFYAEVKAFYNPYAFFALILLSATAVYIGLRLLSKKVPMRF